MAVDLDLYLAFESVHRDLLMCISLEVSREVSRDLHEQAHRLSIVYTQLLRVSASSCFTSPSNFCKTFVQGHKQNISSTTD